MKQGDKPTKVVGWFKDGKIDERRGVLSLSKLDNTKASRELAVCARILNDKEENYLVQGELSFPSSCPEPKEGETKVYAHRYGDEILGLHTVLSTFYFNRERAEEAAKNWRENCSAGLPVEVIEGIIRWKKPEAEVVVLAVIDEETAVGIKPVKGWVYYLKVDMWMTGRGWAKAGKLYQYTRNGWEVYTNKIFNIKEP